MKGGLGELTNLENGAFSLIVERAAGVVETVRIGAHERAVQGRVLRGYEIHIGLRACKLNEHGCARNKGVDARYWMRTRRPVRSARRVPGRRLRNGHRSMSR